MSNAGKSAGTDAIIELTSSSFHSIVQAHEKLVVVEFYTTTCPNCAAIEPVYEELAWELHRYASFARINAQVHVDVAQRFGILGVPTFKFFCKKRPIGDIVGAVNATILRNTIKDFIKHRTECASRSTPISYEMDGYM